MCVKSGVSLTIMFLSLSSVSCHHVVQTVVTMFRKSVLPFSSVCMEAACSSETFVIQKVVINFSLESRHWMFSVCWQDLQLPAIFRERVCNCSSACI